MHNGRQVEVDCLVGEQQGHPQCRGNDLLARGVNSRGRGTGRVLEGIGEALLGGVGGGREWGVRRGWHSNVVDCNRH